MNQLNDTGSKYFTSSFPKISYNDHESASVSSKFLDSKEKEDSKRTKHSHSNHLPHLFNPWMQTGKLIGHTNISKKKFLTIKMQFLFFYYVEWTQVIEVMGTR